ncbi:tetratricopeptide repeat protein [bacterium]|nr:tetratricopeptide repeat protein [bacterium]MBU1958218.1 tetratricopeptide repeat protein [bacterium]
MYLSANNNTPKTSILSLKEILGIVIVFSFVLYLLFPKGDIENIMIESHENTNLSINYLESMLLYYPDNSKLQMSLVKNYRFRGDLEKAIQLNNELMEKELSQELLDQVHKYRYLLLKDSYFQEPSKIKQKTLLVEVQQTLLDYFNHQQQNQDYFFFFSEATQMNIPKLEYSALQGLMNQRKDLRIHELEEQAFYLAISLEKKEDAYAYLQKLLQYKELNPRIAEDALNLLMEHKAYEQVADIATKLFLTAKNNKDEIRFFNIALYGLSQNPKNQHDAIQDLIQHYLARHELKSYDIIIIINSFLQVGALDEANKFVEQTFKTYLKEFNEAALELAINSFVFNSKLPFAQELVAFTYEKFPTQKWLDKKIQIATWLGDVEEAVGSNIEGYRVFGDDKYETYLLESGTLDTAYEILGEIYQNKVESGAYQFVEKLAEYFEYIGEIPKAETYFLNLYQRIQNEPIQKQAILFSYKNSHFAQGIALYENYKKHYGIDKWLHELSIKKLMALKEFKKSELYAQALEPTKVYNATAQKLLEKLYLPNDSDFYTQLIDLSWMHKSYPYLYKILWKLEKQKSLKQRGYEKLVQLEDAINKGKRIAYLYENLWEKTKNDTYLFALFYKYSEDKNFDALTKLIGTLNPTIKKALEKSIQYQILLANYYAQTTQMNKALSTFKKALKLDKSNATTHQAYLWFLLDNHNTKALLTEVNLLKKSPQLQSQVGFPSVVAAMELQQSDLALRWLKPLLKFDKKNIEYQVLYADILELQDRSNGAKKIRMHLFKVLNSLIKQSPQRLKEKDFARVYLRLVTLYVTPYGKKSIYFKQLQSLFKEEDYMQMKIGWHTMNNSEDKVKYLADKHHINIPWLNLYLAISRGDDTTKQQLLQEHKNILPFRDRVMAALDIGDRATAYTLAFKGLEENSRDTDLYSIYWNMIKEDDFKGQIRSKYTHLSDNLTAIESEVYHRWHLFKGIESKLSFTQYRYQQRPTTTDNTLALTLKNSHTKFLWDFTLEQHNSDHDFLSASLETQYSLSDLTLGLNAHYQTKTLQTPELQTNAMMDSFEVSLQKPLSHRIQVGASYKENSYSYQNKTKLGDSKHLQFNGNYILRAAYPDININSYLNVNRYDFLVENHLLPQDFCELGSQLSIGTNAKESFHRSWRPFGSIGLAVNNHQNIGSSLSFGVAGMVNREDALSLQFDYSNGIGAISNPVYGASMNYRF